MSGTVGDRDLETRPASRCRVPPTLVGGPWSGPCGHPYLRPAVNRQPGGCRGHDATSAHPDRSAGVVHDHGRYRPGRNSSRRRCGKPPRPWQVNTGWSARFSPRHQPDPLRGTAATAEHGGDHRVRTEHALNPADGSRHPVGPDPGFPPQPELAAVCADELVGNDADQDDTGTRRDPAGRLGTTDASRQPSFKLPAHPFGDGNGGQRTVMPPDTPRPLAVFGLRLNDYPRAGETCRHKPVMHLFGESPDREDHELDPVSGWVDFRTDGKIGWHMTWSKRTVVLPPGKPVGERSVRPEAGDDVVGRQRGKMTKGRQTQPTQEVREFWAPERLDGQRSEKIPACVRFDNHIPVGGEHGDERPVRDTYPACEATSPGHRAMHGTGHGRVSTEVTRGPAGCDHTLARTDHLNPGYHGLDRGDDRLEHTGIPAGVVRQNHQARTPGLGLPATQTRAHPERPGRLCTGQNLVSRHHHGGDVSRDPGRDKRPVRAADGQYAHLRCRCHAAPSETTSAERRGTPISV